jgi:hypothetical protein
LPEQTYTTRDDTHACLEILTYVHYGFSSSD